MELGVIKHTACPYPAASRRCIRHAVPRVFFWKRNRPPPMLIFVHPSDKVAGYYTPIKKCNVKDGQFPQGLLGVLLVFCPKETPWAIFHLALF
ncbi:MAG: hypothetical protein A3D65_02180 [Candidatus Lloydbacteria bacterium RIFCSPHIGHO2_02_FULL_50_13]|uniref:Uncharacterized protein n=1 Tax=Candidatus Lloydbacteria bacterium RIFCSPHIGHO2_02_FULL_50_13 TaxID=1798661 RepID=A0A1G2D1E5_9BACT|nr:MAG: hypothetical protein A3D65_02180 [Candidatus Lloydbacteria bacterium RIFCSPHIGHO2_02_FULL_50_13]